LELFSLEREGRPVAGRPFRPFGRFATNRLRFLIDIECNLLLMRAARHASRPRGISFSTKFVALLHTALGFLLLISRISAPDASRSARKSASRHRDVDKICRFAPGYWSVFTV